jgi:dolichol kinase
MPILKSRFDEHLSRKFFHVVSGTAVAYTFLYFLDRKSAAFVILACTVVFASIDLARIRVAILNQWVLRIYGPLMRTEENDQPSAQVYYLLGLCWALIALPKIIAVQAILTLAWMDPVAGAYGVRFGKTRWNSVFRFFIPEERQIPLSLGAKTVEGSTAGFFAAFLAGVIAWTGRWAAFRIQNGELRWPTPMEIAVMSGIGAVVAVIAEAWPSQWDDNAKIPFWTGLIVWAAALLMGIPLSYL